MNKSPYEGVPVHLWEDKTKELIDKHPIEQKVLVDAVLKSWDMIYGSIIGGTFEIGENYFPTPQILGAFLHELIPLELAKHDSRFRKGVGTLEKDIHCVGSEEYSFEIKTSSQKDIYGNRSYPKKTTNKPKRKRKSKSGYYLAINFPPIHKLNRWCPISQIRFGWIDEDDWHAQIAESGQQANLTKETLAKKLITLHRNQ